MAHNHNVIRKNNKTFGNLNHKELCEIIITSFLTEKTVNLEEKYNIIVLKIHKKYNKQMIKFAVEAVFTGAKVIDVRTLNYKSVTKNFRGRPYMSSSYKKAYIRLTKDSIIQLGEDQTAITKFTGKNYEHNPTEQQGENNSQTKEQQGENN